MVKVSKTEVNFLSFEGGGGKGLTYLGALQALEVLNIVSYTTKKKNNQTPQQKKKILRAKDVFPPFENKSSKNGLRKEK